MHLEQISNIEFLVFIGGILGVSWLLFRVVPGVESTQEQSYTVEEISAYDDQLPKYFLVAALALTLGGLHTVIKNLPGFWSWLWEAGYGGHLFRDLANSHIVIVGGGTILLTALTWYMLPRFVNRPLYSEALAGISFWMTVVGVFGFYIAWLVLGLIEGSMVRHGWTYPAAKEAIGNWHRIPTALTSSIMGIGYWTYVLNTFLTVMTSRNVKEKPLNHLTKFSIVSAAALFIGTVQGVVQVMPKAADWIHNAGKFGQYIDPISHAHINLVTGMTVSLAVLMIFFGPRMGGKSISKKWANLVFWLLVPGSSAFYLSFLISGLVLGRTATGSGGLYLPVLSNWLVHNRILLLAVSGTMMLIGFWAYFIVLWRSQDLESLQYHLKDGHPVAFWFLSSFTLVIGTLQGMLQIIPTTAVVLTAAEEVPNIHAQLNMIGGVLLALIGVVYLLLPELVGESVDRKWRRISLFGIAGGISGYYVMTLVSGLYRLHLLRSGLTITQAVHQMEWQVPVMLVIVALPMLVGYIAFGTGLWNVTRTYRSRWVANIKMLPDRINGDRPNWVSNIPSRYFFIAEAAGALFGFPGLGWLMSGRALIGVPLALIGPAIAWAVVPLLMSPYGNGPLQSLGEFASLYYLILSTSLSVGSLWLVQHQQSFQHQKPDRHMKKGD